MDRQIEARYNREILDTAIDRFAVPPASIRPLDGFESFIYEYERDGRAYILRIGHSLRRSAATVLGELDWINYLTAGGVSASRAILSRHGRLVEAIDDGHGAHFIAAGFIRAAGRALDSADQTESFYQAYGALLGTMHRLSRQYDPPYAGWRRPHWDAASMQEAARYLPAADAPILAQFRELMGHLNDLPRSDATYGLIHQDAHGGNMFVDEDGTITIFDFDDCCYSWYANDIAIVLFYAAQGAANPDQYTRDFMPSFLAGYRSQTELNPAWLREIPYFLKLRETDLYALIHRSFDVDNIDDPWAARFMTGRRERLLDGAPTIESDFTELES